MEERVDEVIASVESQSEVELLEQRLAMAEAAIAELKAQASAQVSAGRKTIAASAAVLLEKQGIALEHGIRAGALDAALESLSIEQRIAVKSQLMRAGLVG